MGRARKTLNTERVITDDGVLLALVKSTNIPLLMKDPWIEKRSAHMSLDDTRNRQIVHHQNQLHSGLSEDLEKRRRPLMCII